ncbi:uridine diphosphate glucose pyrophosphatase-like [Argonauta hians]
MLGKNDFEEMEPEVCIIFQASGQLIKAKDCQVVLKHDYNRRPLPTLLEEEINKVWERRQSKNPTLYNGTKFRVHAAFPSLDKHGVNLHVGVTCYKDYLGTNWSNNSQHLQNIGLALYGNSQACLSDPLGVGSLLLTTDQRIILLKRSQNCAEAAELWDIPGGHAEPQELVGSETMENIDVEHLSAADVVKEIYDSVLREIRDEVNLPKGVFEEPEMMGIAGNLRSANRPSLEFFVRCHLSSDEVLKLYHKGNQLEADESTSIQSVSVNEVLNIRDDQPLWNTLAPSAKGCFILFINMVLNNVLNLDQSCSESCNTTSNCTDTNTTSTNTNNSSTNTNINTNTTSTNTTSTNTNININTTNTNNFSTNTTINTSTTSTNTNTNNSNTNTTSTSINTSSISTSTINNSSTTAGTDNTTTSTTCSSSIANTTAT